MIRSIFLFCIIFSSLYSRTNDAAIDEVRLELNDLKHALHTYQVDLRILEEKMKKQEGSLKNLSTPKPTIATNPLEEKLQLLEKKIALLEKGQEKTAADLRTLSSYATQTTNSFSQYSEKIQELETSVQDQKMKMAEAVKLQKTLSSLSKSIKKQDAPVENASTKVYKVKAGDNLEKIAKAEKTSVETIKKLNKLENDKICIGQTLKIKDEHEKQ